MDEQQVEKIKKQLIEQIKKSSVKNKEEIINSVDDMDEEELEEFLKENKMIGPGKCIFCSIVEGEAESINIGKNEEAIAILEINPVSKGHSLIIPKIHSKEISKKTLELAQEIAEKLKILEPKKIEVIPKNLFGHEILNILPVYDSEAIDSERYKEEKKELEKLQEALSKLKVEKTPTKEEPKKIESVSTKTHWLPKRVP